MNLCIVGTGAITNEVLPLMKRCGWEVIALCGTQRSLQLTEKLCGKYQIPLCFGNFLDVLKQKEFDAVYLAVPNHLHFPLACQALEAGQNVIIEKPLASNAKEAEQLFDLAKKHNCFLFEAISTAYLPNYQKVQELLPNVGDVKLAVCHYCQYSRRYDAFVAGKVLPAFDPEKSGGAVMDINLYNIHYLIGLFGVPQKIAYSANVKRGIDTSGVLTLQYDGFQAVAIGAKDCSAPCFCMVQGTRGYFIQRTPANTCGEILLHWNDGTEINWDTQPEHRLIPEFQHFAKIIATGKPADCHEMLERSLQVSRIQTEARRQAGIRFPADCW